MQTKIEQFTKALEVANIDPKDWFLDCSLVNEALWQASITDIGLDWYSTSEGGFVQIGYYSNKLHYRIVLDSDVSLEYDTLKDMAYSLYEYQAEADRLEESITVAK